MSRSSYSKPSVPNQGSPGTPNTQPPKQASVPNKPRPTFTTPDKHHSSGVHTPGTPSSGQSGAGTGGRSDRGRNTPKPA